MPLVSEKLSIDGQVAHYLALADEGTKATKNKEAEMLFATAEMDLDDQEDHQAALSSAEEALNLYRNSGDKVGIVDTLRAIIKCYCSKLQNIGQLLDIEGWSAVQVNDEKKATITLAKALAQKELATFKEAKDERGEAAMTLSLAEVALYDSESETDCVKAVAEAAELCAKAKDAKLEASAALILATAHMKMGQLQEAYMAASKAVTSFHAASDQKGQAQALHAQGVIADMRDQDGSPCFKQALAICKEKGYKKMEALELHHMAVRLLAKDNSKLAVPIAKEALAIFAEINSGKRWHWTAVGTLSKALVQKGDEKGAIKLCSEAVATSKKAEANVPTIMLLTSLFSAHMESVREGDPMKAVAAAMEIINLSMAEGNAKLEANGRLNLAQVMLRFWRLDMALHWTRTALGIYKQLGDGEAATDAMNMLTATYLKGSKFEHAMDTVEFMQEQLNEQGRTVREAASNLLMAQCIFQKLVTLSEPEFDPKKLYGWGAMAEEGGEGDAQKEERSVTSQDALRSANKALDTFKTAGDAKSQGMTWEFLGSLQHHDPESGDAVSSMQSAASVYQKCGDHRAQAFVCQQLTQVLLEMGSTDPAVSSAAEACTLARKTRDLKLEVQMLLAHSHAQTQRSLKKMEKGIGAENEWLKGESGALQPAREAVALCRKLKDRYALPIALTVVAEIYCLGGQLDDAQKVIEEALGIYREDWESGDWKQNNAPAEGRSLIVAAEIHFMQKEEDDAKELMAKANQLFTIAHDDIGIRMVQECLTKFAEKEEFKPTAGVATAGLAEEVPGAATGPAEATAVAAAKTGMSHEVAKLLVMDKVMESIGDVDDLHMDTPLMDAGLDSLAAVSFRTTLMEASNIKLPSSIVFDYPDPKSLIEFLVEESMA